MIRVDAGRIEYGRALALQLEMVEARRNGWWPDALLFCEHAPVVTLGRRGKPEDAAGCPFPVFPIDRGGEATYHGPGQVVGYPILHLAAPRAVGKFLRGLERILIRALGDFGVEARPGPQAGVWTGDRKIASIGVTIRRGVTYHGFALNVSTDLAHFRAIRPCGLDPDVMTSVERELGFPVPLSEVKGRIWERFSEAMPLA